MPPLLVAALAPRDRGCLGLAGPCLAAPRPRARRGACSTGRDRHRRLPRRRGTGLVGRSYQLHRPRTGRPVLRRATGPDSRDAGRPLRPSGLEPLGGVYGGVERDPLARDRLALVARLRLQLGIPVEIVHPAVVQVVRRELPAGVLQLLGAGAERLATEMHAGLL